MRPIRWNTTATITRRTTTSDGMGGQIEQWGLVGQTPARLSQPAPAAREAADQASARITHDVYLPPDADVGRGDRLEVRGLALLVSSVIEPSEPIYRKAECTSDQYQGRG